jgi:signal transduction histidine kinase
MKIKFREGIVWIVLGLLFIAGGQVLLVRNENLGPELALQREAERVGNTIKEAHRMLDSAMPVLRKQRSFDENQAAVKLLTNKQVDLFVFRENKPVFWTSNAYNVLSSYGRSGNVEIQKHASRYIILWNYYSDSLEFTIGTEIIANPEFRMITGSSLQLERHTKFGIATNPIEGSMPVMTDGAAPLFYLVVEEFTPGIAFDIVVLLGFLLVALGFILMFSGTQLWLLSYALPVLFGFVLEYLFYKNLSLWNLKNASLFAPEIYASSWYFPNLGVLLFTGLLSLVLMMGMKRWVQRSMPLLSSGASLLLHVVALSLFCWFSVFFLRESGFLVRDSSIVFDFHEIYRISKFTILGLGAAALGYLILIQILEVLKLTHPGKWAIWLHVTAISISTIYLIYQREILLAAMFLVLSGGLLIAGNWSRGYKTLWYLALRIVVPCVALSVIFNKYIDQKELEVREILAARLLLQSEREPSALLQRTEEQLNSDLGIVDYYTCTDVSKSDFEKRLRQLYFGDYSEDYELQLFDFNPLGAGYRQANAYDYVTLNALYTSVACKPVTKNFHLVNERKLKGSFLGKFPVSDSNQWYGTYFVLLKPKLTAASGRLSDVFQKSPLEAISSNNQYSYAFYSGGKLSRRYGQYNYPNNYAFPQDTNLQKLNKYSHFLYSDDLGNRIIISKQQKSWLQELTAFTILVLSCLVAALLYLLIMLLRQYFLSLGKADFARLRLLQLLRNKLPLSGGSNLFLSTKLQLYVIMVVFATFIVVLFVTVNYFKNSYSQRQRESLWNKTDEIANAFGNQTNLQAVFDQRQAGLVYDLSNYYSSDINVYDQQGRLLVSSNDRIYDQNIMGSLMNPGAFRELQSQKISGFIREEKLGDLTYISAYYTIFDNDLNVKGYLNLPYFTNRQDLFREISDYATTIINLFALVFAIAALVAYVIAHRITEPLNLIRLQMGLVKLGARNAPIEWNHNDEIGLLIAEYNKMINELEVSSNKLAEGERQGAWREMAKQVAHEIKNPLTPMKLSLQHLQYAIERKDPNLDDKYKKTTDLLIKQIDSLSKMAEEFSAFAKMPEARLEEVSLAVLIDETVQLFSKEQDFSIHYTPISNELKVQVDPHQMTRVFTNIFKNATQAIPDNTKGLLRVSGQVEKGNIVLRFEDNGKGIPDALAPHIFSPNFSTKNSGMGLGLAMSKKIVEQFGGKISFQSAEGKGTTFFITLPLLNAV